MLYLLLTCMCALFLLWSLALDSSNDKLNLRDPFPSLLWPEQCSQRPSLLCMENGDRVLRRQGLTLPRSAFSLSLLSPVSWSLSQPVEDTVLLPSFWHLPHWDPTSCGPHDVRFPPSHALGATMSVCSTSGDGGLNKPEPRLWVLMYSQETLTGGRKHLCPCARHWISSLFLFCRVGRTMYYG